MESWYFAYGSNLWMDQMIERTDSIGNPENGPRIARLANHRLVFQRLDAADEAFANILCPGDGVLGVVYRCSQTDLERLDHYEGGYERRSITVTDQHGEVLAAVAYFLIPAQAAITGRPTAAYLERIVGGARQHGFPEEYIRNIAAIADSAILRGDHSEQFDCCSNEEFQTPTNSQVGGGNPGG